MNPKNPMHLLFCLPAFLLPSLIRAEAEDLSAKDLPAKALPAMVVTAGRTGDDPDTVPLRTETRDAMDLNLGRMPRSVPESFREIPSVMIQKTGHGQGSPYLRGWTGFRTLMLVDGVRMNNSVYRDGPNQYWSTIDPLSLDRLELVMGPGSVMHGSDAIGGTAQAFTPDPLARLMAGDTGRAYTRAGSAERSLAGRVELVVPAGENSAIQAGVTYKSYGDLRSGDGKQPNTGYEEWAVDSKISGLTPDENRWTLAYQEVEILDAPRTHRTVHAVPFRGTEVGTDLKLDLSQSRRLFYAAWDQPHTSGPWQDLRAMISWHRQAETQDRLRGDGRRDLQSFTVHTHGLSLQGSLGETENSLTVGADAYWDRVSSDTTRFAAGSTEPMRAIQGPVGDDADYYTLGLFASHRRRLAENWEAILGLRGETTAASIGRFENPQTGEADSMDENWQSLVGSAQLRHSLTEHWQLHGGVSQGFRAPNLSDLTRLGVARSGEVEIPSPDLDPERFLNYEMGLRRSHSELSGELTLWYTDVRDLIGRKPTGASFQGEPSVTKTNAANGHLWGVEASLNWDFLPAWRLWSAISWQDGTVDSFLDDDAQTTREPFSRLMPLTKHVGLRHQLNPTVWMEAVVTRAETADKLSAGDRRDRQRIPEGGTPAYTVFHLRTGWELGNNTSLSLALENVLDENYRVHGSGLNEPGRNLVVALEKRF
ncbi:MAG: TonB-dependent receptor [Verrucomicrobia bacterium]|nr:TonB-dependent receptor [Verrucomicrobiota bacterium]MCH8513280.1 TonB-dependent receptor [Kiritimatiellia bacterium]